MIAERDELKAHCARLQALLSNISYPPGHFYSPVVDVNDLHAIEAVRNRTRQPLPEGIVIDPQQMTRRIERWAAHPVRFPFPRHRSPEYRYYFDNPFFGCHDGLALFSVLMEFKPRRVVEVGCGYSSRLLLDVNQRFFDSRLDITLIDPALDDLEKTSERLDAGEARRLSQKVQDVPLEIFERLDQNDILFVDSSHVSKTGSDVNHYLFRIVPRLRPGVLIHVHDILYPFEYLEDWVLQAKRSWNEAYLIHAFLQFNPAFEIVYWANFASHRLRDTLAERLPLCLENEGGSLWLRRKQ